MPSASKKPFVIGLVGGIASGKSHVAQQLTQLGAEMVNADQIGHEVLNRPMVIRTLAQEFGESILQAEGTVNRERIASLVFDDSPEGEQYLRKLESIVHPLIHAQAVRQLRALGEKADPPKVIVIDAPLLLEANWAPMCDVIFFVEAPESVRLGRALDRGWTAENFHRREKAQMSLDDKRKASTHIIDGCLAAAELDMQLKSLLHEIQ